MAPTIRPGPQHVPAVTAQDPIARIPPSPPCVIKWDPPGTRARHSSAMLHTIRAQAMLKADLIQRVVLHPEEEHGRNPPCDAAGHREGGDGGAQCKLRATLRLPIGARANNNNMGWANRMSYGNISAAWRGESSAPLLRAWR